MKTPLVHTIQVIGQFIKRRWMILVGLVLFIIIILVGINVYEHYTYVTLPKKQQNEAVDRLENKLHSEDPSISLPCAYYDILFNKSLYEGKGWVRDRVDSLKKEAFNILEKEAFAGEPLGQYYLGQYYCHVVNPRDITKAAYWWNEAAQGGCSKAYGNLGICYWEGEGVKEDMSLAVYWLRMGAEAGEAHAQYYYGNLFFGGVTYNGETLIPKDLEQAKYWWRKAAEQGQSDAKDALQKIYD